MINYFRVWVMGMCMTALVACDDKPAPPKPVAVQAPKVIPAPTPTAPVVTAPHLLTAKTSKRDYVKPNCQGEHCPRWSTELVQLQDAELDQLVEQSLLKLINSYRSDKAPVKQLNAAREQFWREAETDWQMTVSSQLVYQQEQLAVVQLDTSLYNGGAHDVPVTRYVVLQRQPAKVLALSDLLLAGQEPKLWALVKQQHQAWLRSTGMINEPEFPQTWPFIKNNNVALTQAGLVVKYQTYDISPFAMGQPELTVSYKQLAGIIKPEWLPK